MEVNNDKWHEAKQILQDAIKPQKGKQYLACEVRPSTRDDFKAICLDIADCWPKAAETKHRKREPVMNETITPQQRRKFFVMCNAAARNLGLFDKAEADAYRHQVMEEEAHVVR